MDREVMSILAGVAAESYRRSPDFEDKFAVEPVFSGPTEAFVIYNDEVLIIAFRGTNSLEDTRLDIDFRKTKLSGLPGKYHRGFVRALNKVLFKLYSKIQFKGGTRKVYLVGHSLGGALAVLAAARLAGWCKDDCIEGVFTTGAPRVMNAEAAKFYNERLYSRTLQVENLGDEIPHVPMLVWGYRHVGKRVILPNEEEVRGSRLFKFILQWLPSVATKLFRTQDAHDSKEYVRRVDLWVSG